MAPSGRQAAAGTSIRQLQAAGDACGPSLDSRFACLGHPWPSWLSLGWLPGSWGADLALAGSENKLRRDSHLSPISLALAPSTPSSSPRPVCGFPQPTLQPTHLRERKCCHPSSGTALHSHPAREEAISKLESSMPGRSTLTARRAVSFRRLVLYTQQNAEDSAEFRSEEQVLHPEHFAAAHAYSVRNPNRACATCNAGLRESTLWMWAGSRWRWRWSTPQLWSAPLSKHHSPPPIGRHLSSFQLLAIA